MYFLIGLTVVSIAVLAIIAGASIGNFRRAANAPDGAERKIMTEVAVYRAWIGAGIAIAIIVVMLYSAFGGLLVGH